MNRTIFNNISAMLMKTFSSELNENDRQFIKRIFATSPEVYSDRLRALGLQQCRNVLDAGCGFGQWSLCLACLGPDVIGVEQSPLRVRVANKAFECVNASAHAITGSLDALPLETASMDGVFCYGTIFCTPWKEVLAEFARILRPGGKLYFSANEIGYILNMWNDRPHRNSDFDPREAAANTFRNTLEYEKHGTRPVHGQIIITRNEACEELEQLNFELVAVNAEGTVNIYPDEIKLTPFFKAEYMGLPGCYEVLAIKRS